MSSLLETYDPKRFSLYGRGRKRTYCLFLLLLFLLPLSLKAQQFSVSRFRTIPNDLTAFHTPVYDLNHDACALIKVVGDARFVFDSPLGIVKRTDEVGEIWIYLPQGSVMLTIRHPEWGVLRDYRLGEPLVSNITYELVLAAPVQTQPPTIVKAEEPKIEKMEAEVEESMTEIPPEPDVVEEQARTPVKEQLHTLALAQVGISAKTVAYGLRIALLRKHGVYLSAESDFKSVPSTAGECDADGVVKGKGSAAYYSGEIRRSLLRVMGGGIHRIVGGLHVYEGIGYGRYVVTWGTSGGGYYKNMHDSAIGLSGEVGAMYRWGRVAFLAGASTIMGKYWEANVGVGVWF